MSAPSGVSPTDLRAHRDALQGKEPGESSGKSRIERVIKMFAPAEEIKIIKDEPSNVTIGTPSIEIKIRPMSTDTLLESLVVIRKLIGPLMAMSNKTITITDAIEQFGENVKELPVLIYNILKRGNSDTVTQEWVNENLDVMLDLQVIIPIFLRQNALDKLFGGGGASPKADAAKVAATETEASPTTTQESSPE